VEVTGGTTTFTQDSFATTLYAGTSAAQTITNGINLSGDGGLVWLKVRNAGGDNYLIDTERGGSELLSSNSDSASSTVDTYPVGNGTRADSTGFSIGPGGAINGSGFNYVSWTFKKQAKFFDIVTWTGDGNDNRQISHSLGSAPATIIIKSLNFDNNWLYNTNFGASSYDLLYLDLTNAASSENYSTGAIKSAPTDSTFTLKNSSSVNGSGNTYVAYLFAHDTASDSYIQCGSYTGGGNSDVEVNLGWKPQWLLIRRSDAAEDWFILDTARGLGSDGDPNAKLEPNLNSAETSSSTGVAVTDTGFFTTSNTGAFNASGGNYIYIAIRASTSTDSAITWPSSVKWPSGVAPTTPAPGTKDLFTFLTTDGGTTYYGKKAAEGLA
jgi:hypothetical protein